MVMYSDLLRVCMEKEFDEEIVEFRTALKDAATSYKIGDSCNQLMKYLPRDIKAFADHGVNIREYVDRDDPSTLLGVQLIWLDERMGDDDDHRYIVTGGTGIIHLNTVDEDCKKLRMKIAEYFCVPESRDI